MMQRLLILGFVLTGLMTAPADAGKIVIRWPSGYIIIVTPDKQPKPVVKPVVKPYVNIDIRRPYRHYHRHYYRRPASIKQEPRW